MCGIAGIVSFDGHSPEQALATLRAMNARIRHRGPDDEGFHVDASIAFGHRRLSIIDVSGGHQPMATADGVLQIVFNGEIYNYLELRRELAALGHAFRTNSDTEVILAGYRQWGEQAFERLNGMFAVALWDGRVRTLVLARDRVGKKPLYVLQQGQTVWFASELKALRAVETCPTALDDEALDCYLTLGYVPAPRTILAGVRKLMPATVLRIGAEGRRERRYWRLSFAAPRERSLDEALEEFGPLFDEAVRCRLMSEVPIGAFLSGGIDSSLVVESMARQMGRPLVTHSIGFDAREGSELPVAAAIATALGTQHREFLVTPRAEEVLARVAWHADEPLADSSTVPTWYVCAMTRQSVTVALSGDGGDEGFGGYTFRYRPHAVESRLRRSLPAGLRRALFGPLGAAWPASARLPRPLRLRTIFQNLAVGDPQAFYRDLSQLRDDARAGLYAPAFLERLRGYTPADDVIPLYAGSDAPDALGRSQATDVALYMTDDVLVKVDRMSMAHGLEVRAPLLDYRVLEFAARLPARLRLHGGVGKVLLRALAARRLPPGVDRLPKRGFAAPIAGWLRGELRPLVEDVLLGGGGPWEGRLQRPVIERLWRAHLSGARDHSDLAWSLLTLGLWSRGQSLVVAP
ncbi:MAG: asparagine synthase (glutamine-hydrolyzing) [Proteobacteria bacterium]|nr:asparagine synthase (glutamine-hydrolyzing) [Pseudomonadota bacterium]